MLKTTLQYTIYSLQCLTTLFYLISKDTDNCKIHSVFIALLTRHTHIYEALLYTTLHYTSEFITSFIVTFIDNFAVQTSNFFTFTVALHGKIAIIGDAFFNFK